jgi:Nup93/Nic96
MRAENKHPYYLAELQQMVRKLGASHFKDEASKLLFAKVLMQLGLFNDAIKEMQAAGFFVEALFLGLALNELGLLASRQDILGLTKDSKCPLSEDDLAVLYEQSIDLDATIMGVVDKAQARQD